MDEDHLDFGVLASRFRLDQDKIVELFGLFLKACKSDVAQLRSAVTGNDSVRAVAAAHSIKGAALSFSLIHLSQRAKEIEHIARSGTVQGITEYLPELVSRLQALARLSQPEAGPIRDEHGGTPIDEEEISRC